jgi:hypothetical protein
MDDQAPKAICPICRKGKEYLRQLNTASLTKTVDSMRPLEVNLMANQSVCSECWDSMIAGILLKAHECRRGNML